MEKQLYYKYSEYMRQRFGGKVYKIPVTLPCTCPNRDGTKGYGGCIYCSGNPESFEAAGCDVSVSEQILRNIEHISKKYKANKFELYAQSFTNTYMPPEQFEKCIESFFDVGVEGVVMISISTRPDCISEEYLDILKKASEQHSVEITVELGLQSTNTKTLKILNRCHTLADYIGAVLLIKKYGFHVCTHIITTFPWDDLDDVVNAAQLISTICEAGDSVKLHSLYIEKGTTLDEMYRQNQFELLSLDDYVERTVAFIENLRSDMPIQRLSSRVTKINSEFSNWGRSHWVLTDKIVEKMTEREISQGNGIQFGSDSAVKHFIQR